MLTIEFASKFKIPKIPKTNKLPNANDNFVIKVIKEKSVPETSSLYFNLWISVKSAWIDGGRTKSAPRQNPVRQEIIMNKKRSPEVRKITKIKKKDEVNKENDHAFALLILLLK